MIKTLGKMVSNAILSRIINVLVKIYVECDFVYVVVIIKSSLVSKPGLDLINACRCRQTYILA